jgi:hypothetical protein
MVVLGGVMQIVTYLYIVVLEECVCICVSPLYFVPVLTGCHQQMQAFWNVALCQWVSSSRHLRGTAFLLQHWKVLTQQHSITSQTTWMCSSIAVQIQNLASFWSIHLSPALITLWAPEYVLGRVPSVWLLLSTKGGDVRCLQYMRCLSYIIVNIFIDGWLLSAEANLWGAQLDG